MKIRVLSLMIAALAGGGAAQSQAPATRPSSASGEDMQFMSADQVLDQMLKPTTQPVAPLEPLTDRPAHDENSGPAAVIPNAPRVHLLREGTFIVDRLGRLSRTDSGQAEFTFESDGRALKDPPLILLPNLALSQLEDGIIGNSRDMKVRMTGLITEYKGRNYLLIEKFIFPPDVSQQF